MKRSTRLGMNRRNRRKDRQASYNRDTNIPGKIGHGGSQGSTPRRKIKKTERYARCKVRPRIIHAIDSGSCDCLRKEGS